LNHPNIDSAIKWNFFKHIHLVCLFEISQIINTNSYTKNLSLEDNNETVSIVSQLNNTEVIHKVDNLEHEKQKIKNIFDTILHTVSSLEELDVLNKCLSFAQPTLLALRNNMNKKPFKKISLNISPKKEKNYTSASIYFY